jgi:hypothetical protein
MQQKQKAIAQQTNKNARTSGANTRSPHIKKRGPKGRVS